MVWGSFGICSIEISDWKRRVAWLSEENDSVKVVDGTLVEEYKWVVLSLRKGVANLTI